MFNNIDLSANISKADIMSEVTSITKAQVERSAVAKRMLARPQVITHVIGFIGEAETVRVALRPAGYAHFFFLVPLGKILERNQERRDLGILTKLCLKAEELHHKSPDNPVYMKARQNLIAFMLAPSYD